MSRIDKAPEGGKFRATANASLDGTAGAWGNGDLLNVALDAGGLLVAGTATDVDGVILTSEGQDADLAANKNVIGGRVYTVFFQCEIVEVETFVAPTLAAGDTIWAKAAGDVGATGALNDLFVGTVLAGGNRAVIWVNGKQPSP